MPGVAKLSEWLVSLRGGGRRGCEHPESGGAGPGGHRQMVCRTISSFSNISTPWASRSKSRKQQEEGRVDGRWNPGRQEREKVREKVPIDGNTQVSIDLYEAMLEAGHKARLRGQHRPVVHGGSPDESGDPDECWPTVHLVISEVQIDI